MFLRRPLLRLLCNRGFHSTKSAYIDAKHVEEVRIPVPWGHIAGRWWGSKDTQPILALHGWQDNAGSWEPLLELMPDHLSFLAIDFPGSGLSSHLPPFQNYHFVDSTLYIHRIKLHYDFGPMILLGHSGGSASCFVYSSLFPENVLGYFGIDYLLQAYGNNTKRAEKTGPLIDQIISLSLRDPANARSYTWEEIKENWIKATNGSINNKSAEILMKRGVSKLPNGKFIFNRDGRIKANAVLEAFSITQILGLVEHLNCHISLIKGNLSPLFDKGIKNTPNILDIIKKKAKSFEFNLVEGNHHCHMDVPELILPHFLNFMKKF